MAVFAIKRVGYGLLSLLLLALTIFTFTRIAGDPALLIAGVDASPDVVERVREELGLNRSLHVQFLAFVGDFLSGRLGDSAYYRMPVIDLILGTLPATLLLCFTTFALSLLVGVPLGVLTALHADGLLDRVGRVLVMFSVALPGFWVGLVLILIFAIELRWLPAGGMDTPASVILPAIALSGFFIAAHMRIARSAMLDALDTEFVKFLRAKGLSRFKVVWIHAFRSSLIPIVTLAGINLALMVNASVAVEAAFNWPGIGSLLFESVSMRDFPLAQGIVLLQGIFIIVFNLMMDFVYAFIDPRIKIRS